MPHLTALRCIRCAKDLLPAAAPAYTCACGGNLLAQYDFDRVRRELSRAHLATDPDRTLWRYAPLLPVDRGTHAARLNVGWTPLLDAPALAAHLGLKQLQLKDETRHPSGSLKDRAGAIALAVAHARGETRVAGASTGNAASSLACLAARTGMKTTIFVPESAPPAKLAQILLFGATVIQVRGTYDQAFDLCLQACQEYGWYNRNTGFNPFTREGKKTVSFEIAEQRAFEVPDWVVVPVGDGNILSGVWKGFVDFKAAGLIDRLPKLLAAQASGSNAVTLALEGDGKLRPVSGTTIADSISVSLPRDGEAAVAAVRESKGAAVAVPDEEILAAMRLLARTEGVFAEPAAATAIACLSRAVEQGKIPKDASVVALITGSGLKDVVSAMKAAGTPHLIDPDLASLKRLIEQKEKR
ncbi:MAG: thrC [Myxococcaceae bacterium]|nr:thrC [Myxococcaceae bacterium]